MTEQISGTSTSLTPTGGNDTLTGSAGNDTIDGGAGFDTVIYTGDAASYQLSHGPNGELTVQDLVPSGGDTGIDILRNVEVVQFANATVRWHAETAVNSFTSGEQLNPASARLNDGGYVVTWMSDSQDGSGWGIYAQRYDAAGVAVGSETQVNASTASNQMSPVVSALSAGGYVITWMSYTDGGGYGIYAQRFDATGARVGDETLVNESPQYSQEVPAVVGMADGGHIVIWSSASQDGSDWGVYARRFDASGIASGAEWRVNTTATYSQYEPQIAALADGGFVVAWTSVYQDGSGAGIYAQRYDASGIAIGSEFRVNSYTSYDQSQPAIAGLPDGGFVVTWYSTQQDGSGGGIYSQRYSPDGAAVGVEARVNTETAQDQQTPAITALTEGGYVIVWMSYAQDGSTYNILAQRFGTQGEPIGDPRLINSVVSGDQMYPSVSGLADGGYLVTWQSASQDGSGFGIYSQRVGPNGAGWKVEADASITPLEWTLTEDVHYQAASGNDTVFGGTGNDLLSGGAGGDMLLARRGNDELRGEGGNDRLQGDAGSDTLFGGAGVDTLVGSDGNDVLHGGDGNDQLSGMAGFDTAVFRGAYAGYELTLNPTGITSLIDIDASDGDDGTDQLASVERIQFANYRLDLFRLEPQVNTTTTSDTSDPAVSTFADGSYVIAWSAYQQDGSGWGIYAQRYSAAGNKIGAESRVNAYSTYDQTHAAVTTLTDGGYLVTWTSVQQDGSSDGIFAQRFHANGTVVGAEFQINGFASYAQMSPTVAALPDGGFLVAWVSQYQDGSEWGVFLRRYAADGTLVLGDTQVNTSIYGAQQSPAVSVLPDGGYVVTWMSMSQTGSSWDIFAQRYQADGTASGGEYQVNTTTASEQWSPSIVALSDGSYLIVWMGIAGDGSGNNIYGQRFSAAGVPIADEFRINTTVAGEQTFPQALALAGGAYVVVWQSYSQSNATWDLLAQRFDALGQPVNDEFLINTTTFQGQYNPSVASLPDGGFVVTWQSEYQASGARGIFHQRFDAYGNVAPGPVDVTLSGTVGSDLLALPGSVPVRIQGLEGNDTLSGGYGADTLDGGSGADVVTYAGSLDGYRLGNAGTGSVTVTDLSNSNGWTGQDTVVQVERIQFEGAALINHAELRVNTTVSGYQGSPNVAALSDGGHLVVWYGQRSNGTGNEIRLQRFDIAGMPSGDEVLVSSDLAVDHYQPSITLLSDGSYAVVWQSYSPQSGTDIRLQRFASTGTPVGVEENLTAGSNFDQGSASISALSEGGYIVAWTSYGEDGSGGGVYARRYDSTGAALDSAFRVNSTVVNEQFGPAVVGLAGGGFVVSWSSYGQDGGEWGVFAQCYDASGVAMGSEFRVNDYDAGTQIEPSVVALKDGGFVVAWTSYNQDSYWNGVYAKCFDAAGDPRGSEFRVNTFTSYSQDTPVLGALGDGGFIAVWSSQYQDGSSTGIYAQRYAADGSAVGSETLINTTTAGDQAYPAVSGLPDGGYVVTWQSPDGDSTDVYTQRFNADGSTVVLLGDAGNNVLSWQGTQGLLLQGLDGSDTLTGGAGGDTLEGGTGADVLDGSGGDDQLRGATGNDSIDGGSGYDAAFVDGKYSGYAVSLGTGGLVVLQDIDATDGDGGIDLLTAVEQIRFEDYTLDVYPREREVNTVLSIESYQPVLATFANGGHVVVWVSYGTDGSERGIFGQLYDNLGNVIGGQSQINSYTTGSQHAPAVSALADGGYVVTWTSNNQDGFWYSVYGQRFDSTGSALGGEFRLAQYQAYGQGNSSVTGLEGGGFLAVWDAQHQDGSGGGIYGRYYAADGTPVSGEFQVNTTYLSHQQESVVTALPGGGAIVVWSSLEQDGSASGIYQQRLAADGSFIGAETRVNTTTASNQFGAAVASLGANGHVVVWTSSASGDDDIYFQRYDSQGAALGPETRANTTVANTQYIARVAALQGGGFVVVWTSYRQDGDGFGIYAQRFDAAGSAVGSEFRVNGSTIGTQSDATVAGTPGGGFIVTWQGVDAATSVTEIHQQYFDANGEVVLGDYAPRLIGTTAADVLTWTLATDATLNGSNGDDTLSGGAGNDTLLGGGGQDLARYDGKLEEYALGFGQAGRLVVTDQQPANGSTGTDELASIETVLFADGAIRLLAERQVNTTTGGEQSSAAMAALADGGYIVVWQSYQDGSGSYDVLLQRYSASGDAMGAELRVNATTLDAQFAPTVTALPDGGFVVAWMAMGDGGGYGIYQQRFDDQAAAVGAELRVNSNPGYDQQSPDIVALVDGGWVVSWISQGQDGSTWGIYAQRYGSDGTAVGEEFRVNTTVNDSQANPAVAALADGGYVLAWASQNQDGSAQGVYLQRFNAAGTRVGGEVLVNSYTSNDQSQPDAIALKDGGYLVVWQSVYQDGSGWGVYAQRFSASGARLGIEQRINSTTNGEQTDISAASLQDGGYVLAWQTYTPDGVPWDIALQRFDAQGRKVGQETRINTTIANAQYQPTVIGLADGGYVVTWQSEGQDGSGLGIYSQRFTADGRTSYMEGDESANFLRWDGAEGMLVRGLAGDDTVLGASGDDHLEGNAGNDQLSGAAGADSLEGGAGADSIAGGGQDDVLSGGAGNDSLEGGAGFDTAVFNGAFADYVIELQSPTQLTVTALAGALASADGVDTLQSVESLVFKDVRVDLQTREHRVNSVVADTQTEPAIASLAGGGHVVVWTSYGQDGDQGSIQLQRYDAAGLSLGVQTRVNTQGYAHQGNASVVGLSDGGFVVAWTSQYQDGSGSGVFAQRYAADGQPVGGEFQVNAHIWSDQSAPSLAALNDGGFVVVWQSYWQDGSLDGIFAQRFTAAGERIGFEQQVNTTYYDSQYEVAVAQRSGGGYTVSWTSGGSGIYQQQFDGTGEREGGEVRVSTDAQWSAGRSSVSGLTGGGHVVVWQAQSAGGTGLDIFMQRFDAAGSPVGELAMANSTRAAYQATPSVVGLASGGYVVVYAAVGLDGSSDVFAQRFDSTGQRQGAELKINHFSLSGQHSPVVTATPEGGFLVAWQSDTQDGFSGGIYQQRFDAQVEVDWGGYEIRMLGSDAADNLQWTSPDAVSIEAGAGNDTLIGGAGNDTIDGALGDDELHYDESPISGYRLSQDASGRLVVVDTDPTNGDTGTDVVAGVETLRFADATVAVYAERQVNTTTAGDQTTPLVTLLAGGSFITTWNSHDPNAGGYRIYTQRFDAQGSPVGAEVRTDRTGYAGGSAPQTIGLADGGSVTVWSSYNHNGYGDDIYLQRYDALGQAIGSSVRVNGIAYGSSQGSPAIAGTTDGGFVVAWMSNAGSNGSWDIYAQRFNAAAEPIGYEFLVNSFLSDYQGSPYVSPMADGGFLVTWQSNGQDGSGSGIYSQRFAADGSRLVITGDEAANTLTWSGQQQALIRGGGGDDVLRVGGAMTRLEGGSGSDAFVILDSVPVARHEILDFAVGESIDISGLNSLTGVSAGNGAELPVGQIHYEQVGADTILHFSLSDVGYADAQLLLKGFTAGASLRVVGSALVWNQAPTGSVVLQGDAAEDQVLTVASNLADPDGLGTFSYQWKADGQVLAGATGQSLTLSQAEVGKVITVTVTWTDGLGVLEQVSSAASATVTNLNDLPSGSVLITGDALEDQQLSASQTLADEDGLGAIAYQWYAGGTAIAGATGDSLLLTQAMVGKAITVAATYTDLQGTVESVSSISTSAVLNVNDMPVGFTAQVNGTSTEGQTLSATAALLSDDDGLPLPLTLQLQWQRDNGVGGWDDIGGATANTYQLLDADVGKAVRARVQYVDAQGTTETTHSDATATVLNVNDAPTGSLTITGTAQVGQTLNLVNALSDEDGLGTMAYQWRADGVDIAGAVSDSVVLTDAEVGKSITVVARFTDQHGTAESVASPGTVPVQPGNAPPTGSVTIGGTATQGQTLTVSNTLADADGLGAISYQWQADGVDIAGATGSSLLLTQAYVGRSLAVVARYTDLKGTPESVASTATAAVANVNDSPTGSVVITGLAQVGQTLVAGNTLADVDGLGAISYQWRANGIDIAGATSGSFVLTAAQLGVVISVVARYADGFGFEEVVASTGTAAVTAAVIQMTTTNYTGTAADENVLGTPAANNISTLAGNDTLDGAAGIDTLVGGTGNDLYIVDLNAAGTLQDTVTETSTLVTEIDTIRLRGSSTNTTAVTLTAGANLEVLDASGTASSLLNLTGNALANRLVGNAARNVITGAFGADTLDGGEGGDLFVVSATGDYAGDSYSDTGTTGTDELRLTTTTAGTLTLNANLAGIEQLVIGTGTGTTATTTGTTAINVNAAAVTGALNLTGNNGANTLTGGAGNNLLTGNSGNDTLVGGAGDDTLLGGVGSDNQNGGEGSDLYLLGSTTDYTGDVYNDNGTLGTDELRFTATATGTLTLTTSVTGIERVVIGTGTAAAAVTSGTTAINISAGVLTSAITLVGNDGANALTGGAGADRLTGNGGNDTLSGGNGNDTLAGGAGSDSLTGGAGQDQFVFDVAPGAGNVDTIASFTVVDDTIHLSATVFAAAGAIGALATGAFNTGTAATQADDRIIYNTATGALLYDADGLGGAAAIQFATLTGLVGTLSAADFTVTDGITVAGGGGPVIDVPTPPPGPEPTTGLSVTGTSGADSLTGGSGNDTLLGGAGADTLAGGDGSDVYLLGSTTDYTGDVVNDTGGSGTDELRYTGTSGATLTLTSSVTGIERFVVGTGTAAAAVTTGTTAISINASALSVGVTLVGNNGGNRLTGGSGADRLQGNGGNDTLTGGAGQDVYVFDTTPGTGNIDSVSGFTVVDDTIQLSAAIFAAAGPVGTLAAGAFNTGTAATQADDRIIYNTATGALLYDADGLGGAAAVQFATLTGLVGTLTSADFVIG